MTTSRALDRNRLYDLLADEASASLDSSDAAELNRLLVQIPFIPRDGVLQAAALAQVAILRRSTAMDRMPAGLRERLASQGEALVLRQRGPATVPRLVKTESAPTTAREPATPRWSPVSGIGWALAAMLAVAFVVVRNEPAAISPVADVAATRASLVNGAPDVITLPWAPPTAAGYEKVTGDVVWSQSRQQGYLRLANMPVNDPARRQYQLWIVDPDRDKNPVDGGVFNVSATGEVIIPIQAKLQIRSPRAFAITAEQPGGVVVSAGPLLIVASI
ncbi:MAG: anti-sigma factor [Gammaproteobacteria bacterium]|nr:anti-sigma factor [Gammaproteobacteria bacterium]